MLQLHRLAQLQCRTNASLRVRSGGTTICGDELDARFQAFALLDDVWQRRRGSADRLVTKECVPLLASVGFVVGRTKLTTHRIKVCLHVESRLPLCFRLLDHRLELSVVFQRRGSNSQCLFGDFLLGGVSATGNCLYDEWLHVGWDFNAHGQREKLRQKNRPCLRSFLIVSHFVTFGRNNFVFAATLRSFATSRVSE